MSLPYERGSLLPDTAADMAKLRAAWRIVERRHGDGTLFNFSGLERSLDLGGADASVLDDDLAPALFGERLTELALEHLGGDPERDDVFVANRLTAAIVAAMQMLVRPGDTRARRLRALLAPRRRARGEARRRRADRHDRLRRVRRAPRPRPAARRADAARGLVRGARRRRARGDRRRDGAPRPAAVRRRRRRRARRPRGVRPAAHARARRGRGRDGPRQVRHHRPAARTPRRADRARRTDPRARRRARPRGAADALPGGRPLARAVPAGAGARARRLDDGAGRRARGALPVGRADAGRREARGRGRARRGLQREAASRARSPPTRRPPRWRCCSCATTGS